MSARVILLTDPAMKAFFDDVVASDAAFLVANPASAFAARQPARQRSVWSRVVGLFAGGRAIGALTAIAAVVVVVVATRPAVTDAPVLDPVVVVDDGLRSKGGVAHVGFFVNSAAGPRPGAAGESLHAGDQIQLAVQDADRTAMVVVGIDGTGAVAVYVSEQIVTQNKGDHGPRLLPASLILDDTTGAERFFVVYGDDLEATLVAASTAAVVLGKSVAAGRVDLATTERLDLDDARLVQASVHILKVR